ncbi:MAG TPA: tandem-95 repeat protein, partial [Burkholderiales bacterium]|nr:tandem-95 repeat protein [Burkholderiales bacterium]
ALLANDADADGDPLVIVSFTQPTNGTVADNGNGTFTYSPNVGFQGADAFTYTVSDGVSTASATVTINVAPQTVPSLDLDGGAPGTGYATTYTENAAPVPVVGPAVSLSDFDDTHLELATITLTNPQAGDVLSVGALPAGIAASVAGNVVTLSGTASLADYRAALQAVTFHNASDDPAVGARVLTIIVNDGDTDSNVALSTIDVVAVNDAPVAAIGAASFTATEQTPLSLVGGALSIADVDSPVLTATLSVGEGVLTVTAGTTGVAVAGSGTDTVTLTGSQAQINALLAGNSGAAVVYLNPSDAPSAATTLTLAVSDGSLSASDSATIGIAAVNDAPVATIAAGGFAATEQTALDLTVGGLSVADVDGPLVMATLTVGEGVLDVSAGATGASVAGAGTGNVTITGTLAQVNALLGGAAGATLSYFNASDTPSASTTLTLTASDGALSSTATATITIAPTPDAPVLAQPIPAQQVAAGSPFTYAIPAGTFSDPDSAFTLAATLADGSALPGWLAFDPTTGAFSGTPPAGFTGLDIRVTASDGTSSASATLALLAPPAAPAADPSGLLPFQDGAQGPGTVGPTPASGSPAGLASPGASGPAPAFGQLPLGQPVDIYVPPAHLAPSGLASPPDFIDLNALPAPAAGPSFPVVRLTDGDPGLLPSGAATNLVFGGHRLFVFHGIPTLSLTGARDMLYVPEDAFAHTDPAARVYLEARLADGRALPAWLQFDGVRGTFSGEPPSDVRGALEIEVIARDDFGREARTRFLLLVEDLKLEAAQPGQDIADLLLGLDVDAKEAEKERQEAARRAAEAKAADEGKGKDRKGREVPVPFSEQMKAARAARDPLLERIAKAGPSAPGKAR